MSRIVMGVALLYLLTVPGYAVAQSSKTDDAMHAKVVNELIGKTRQYKESKNGQAYSITYHKDGTVSAHSANGTSSGGVWRRYGDRVCVKYSNPKWVSRVCHPL